jgi:hypothetical protein
MSKSRKSTKKNSRTRRKRGGGDTHSSNPPKVKTCENLNSQLSWYRENIKILKGDNAKKFRDMLAHVKKLKDSPSNSYTYAKKKKYQQMINNLEAGAKNFYEKYLKKVPIAMFKEHTLEEGIAKYNEEIRYIKENEDWIDQKCKDPVEGGRKSRRKRRRRTNKRKSRRKSRRRKSTKKKRRRRRR